MKAFAFVCFFRGAWRTFVSGVWMDGYIILGCDGQEKPDGSVSCTTRGKSLDAK